MRLLTRAVICLAAVGLQASRTEAQAECTPPTGNAIVCENRLAGNPASEWDISGAGDSSIQGFATDISVNHGQTISFKVQTDATSYRLDIYRLGFYSGMGARRVTTVTPSVALPQSQPGCLTDTSTGLVDCGNWAVSATWAVPATAVSGVYVAKLVRPDTGGASHIVFIVRDDESHADLLFQVSDTTWQAYNDYGGNSLYAGSPAGRAYKVSYNRPFTTRATAYGRTWLFSTEYPMIRWVEANGYNVSYFTGVDTDRLGSELVEHKAFLSVGHDEYWSSAQRSNVEAARAAGVHLAFFTGNEVFWKTRWEPSIAAGGAPYRTLVSYKETHANAVIDPQDPPTWTGTWRDARFSPPGDGGRPENALTGTMFLGNCCAAFPLTVSSTQGRFRFWRQTSLSTLPTGQSVSIAQGILGFELDADLENGARPPGLVRLSATPISWAQTLIDNGSTYGPGQFTHALTLYRHASGALVFGAGTIRWSWGLDPTHDADSTTPGILLAADPTIQQATVNILADMGAQPLTLQPGLFATSASSDTLAPASAVSPTGTLPSYSTVTITGTASDAGGGQVAGVEVSVDGGATWKMATGTTIWGFSWPSGAPGTVTVLTRAIDDSGNLEQPPTGTTVTIGASSGACPCSIWSDSASPATASAPDNQAVEVGMRFRSSADGYVTAIRFYKGPTNTGGHTGTLWSNTGSPLGTVTFSNESASGWQQAALPTPVAITANTLYVVSYHTDTGGYSRDQGFFQNTGVTSGPLEAPQSVTGNPNGVYHYGATAFPTDTYLASNYWVDLVFATSVGPDTTPPTITAINASPSSTTATITWTTNEASSSRVDYGTSPSTLNVTATATGLTTSHSVQLTGLAEQTTYYFRVTSADGSNNASTSPQPPAAPASFTTTTSTFSCPCSIWPSTQIPGQVTQNDAQAAELGLRWRPLVNGFVSGIRFYKGPSNTGTHTGSLWTNAGALLATVTFTGETASGWQQALFNTPVAVTANTTYVVSYHTDVGYYSINGFYFDTTGVTNGPLTALATGVDGANGLYRYGTNAFPTNTYNASNYWVDVVFTTSATDTTPPTVVSVVPASGAANVAVGTPVQATFSETLNPATVNANTFVLQDAANTVVPATVSYNGSTIATLQPSASLSYASSYSARVVGGAGGVKDPAGNALASDVVWTFTTQPMTAADVTTADFNAGTPDTGMYVAQSGDGELILRPTVAAEFDGSALPGGWSWAQWSPAGSAVVGGGVLSVESARASLDTTTGSGVSLEFVATFQPAPWQNVGFGVTFETAPWAMFSSGPSGDGLYARTHDGTTALDTLIPGPWIGTPHVYRIDWNVSSVQFYVDGTLVVTRPATIGGSLRPIVSDYPADGTVLRVDWLRVSPYATSGTFTSRVLTTGAPTNWTTATWTAVVPTGTTLSLGARFGDTSSPDGTWTAFTVIPSSGSPLSQASRYVQYLASFAGTGAATPILRDISFSGTAPQAASVLSIGNASVNEGNSGSTNAVVTVTLTPASTQTVTVQFITADGTATAGSDYSTTAGQLTFAPGVTTATIAVPVLGDVFDEPDETFTINLSGAAGASIATGQGVVTIVDDDPTPSLAINDVTVAEGNSGSISAVFTVALSAASGRSVTVNYATADGTATAGSDYTATSGQLTFAPGLATASVTVPVLGDTLAEANETFVVNLSAPINATIADGQGVGTITDNDAPLPSLQINSPSITEGNSGSVNLVFTVTLSAASSSTVTVNYATADVTATAGSDYVSKVGQLSLPPGTTTAPITVTVLGDVLDEANETFVVNLSGATNAIIATAQGVGTITDDDPTPSLRINDVTVTEGNAGSVNAVFTVTLSAASGRTVTVNYATANGSATAGSDYTATAGPLTFPPGTTTATVTVPVLGDTLDEANETFQVNLSGASNASLADSQGIGTITDDDPPPALSINDVTVKEGNTGTINAVFTVTLSAPSGRTVSVRYATANGTASSNDYNGTSGTLTFSPGATTQTISVAVVGDTRREPDETFSVRLSNASNATIADGTGVCTIQNDD